jgi:hypothetical protein
MTKASRFLCVPLVSGLVAIAACSGDDPPAQSGVGGGAGTPSGAGSNSGGKSGSVGTAGTGGTTPTAGMNSTGGSSGSVSTGGAAGRGGSAGSNGSSGGAAATGGSGGGGGSDASGGNGGSAIAGSAGSSGAGAGSAGTSGAGTGGTGGGGGTDLEPFSFFVSSHAALQALAGNDLGFGGDFKFGETGPGAGLRGADKICATIADRSMPGASAKGWRAFLSATAGEDGQPVNAIDRIGDGPWYDRLGRLVAMNKAALQNARPMGAHEDILNDLPNEDGVPNHRPDPNEGEVDNHHVLTGSDEQGNLLSTNMGATCNDWTSAVGSTGRPRTGLSWPRTFGGGPGGGMGSFNTHWISALDEAGCAPGYTLDQQGGPDLNNPTVGSGGGYGAIYCFALEE